MCARPTNKQMIVKYLKEHNGTATCEELCKYANLDHIALGRHIRTIDDIERVSLGKKQTIYKYVGVTNDQT